MRPDAPILIAGPTASGKSALALRLAERLGGCVINADASQVYREWRVLTARPTAEDEARAPHRLYGHVGAAEGYSVGRWLREVAATLEDCAAQGLRPIVVGGTGLYFTALTEGLADIPPPSPAARTEAADRLAALGRERLARELAARDPATAARIDLANPARLLRAWEALAGGGPGLAALWDATPPPLAGADAPRVVLGPERGWLYARCDARFDAMLEAGALDEARALLAAGLPPEAPAMKAVGARELMAHLRGEISLDAAAAAAKQATRNYAKRQETWFRNRMAGWPRAASPAEAAAILAAKG
jgi:tRNA dimethylallyltransferase